MRRTGSKIVVAIIGSAVVLTSTAAAAARKPVPAQPSPVSWTALSMLNFAGVMGLAGTASKDGQPEVPPAPPSTAQVYAHPGVPYPVISALLGSVAMTVYILAKKHVGHFTFPDPPAPLDPPPNSPA